VASLIASGTLVQCWAVLAEGGLVRHFDMLAVYGDEDFERLQRLLLDLLRAIRTSSEPPDFHAACGPRKSGLRIRMRVLCPRLRKCIGGFGDLAALALRPQRVVVLENLETRLALPDLPWTGATSTRMAWRSSTVRAAGCLNWPPC
jgi:hypothetical protein